MKMVIKPNFFQSQNCSVISPTFCIITLFSPHQLSGFNRPYSEEDNKREMMNDLNAKIMDSNYQVFNKLIYYESQFYIYIEVRNEK